MLLMNMQQLKYMYCMNNLHMDMKKTLINISSAKIRMLLNQCEKFKQDANHTLMKVIGKPQSEDLHTQEEQINQKWFPF